MLQRDDHAVVTPVTARGFEAEASSAGRQPKGNKKSPAQACGGRWRPPPLIFSRAGE
jgi:hypothetical protein